MTKAGLSACFLTKLIYPGHQSCDCGPYWYRVTSHDRSMFSSLDNIENARPSSQGRATPTWAPSGSSTTRQGLPQGLSSRVRLWEGTSSPRELAEPNLHWPWFRPASPMAWNQAPVPATCPLLQFQAFRSAFMDRQAHVVQICTFRQADSCDWACGPDSEFHSPTSSLEWVGGNAGASPVLRCPSPICTPINPAASAHPSPLRQWPSDHLLGVRPRPRQMPVQPEPACTMEDQKRTGHEARPSGLQLDPPLPYFVLPPAANSPFPQNWSL